MCGSTRSTLGTLVFLAVWTDAEGGRPSWFNENGMRYTTRERATEYDTPQEAWDDVQGSTAWDNSLTQDGSWAIVAERKPEPEPVTRLIAYGEDEGEEGAEYLRLAVIRHYGNVSLCVVDASGERLYASTIARFELNEDGKVEMKLAGFIGNPNVAKDGSGVIIHEHEH